MNVLFKNDQRCGVSRSDKIAVVVRLNVALTFTDLRIPSCARFSSGHWPPWLTIIGGVGRQMVAWTDLNVRASFNSWRAVYWRWETDTQSTPACHRTAIRVSGKSARAGSTPVRLKGMVRSSPALQIQNKSGLWQRLCRAQNTSPSGRRIGRDMAGLTV